MLSQHQPSAGKEVRTRHSSKHKSISNLPVIRLNKIWRFETPAHPLWRHCNVSPMSHSIIGMFLRTLCASRTWVGNGLQWWACQFLILTYQHLTWRVERLIIPHFIISHYSLSTKSGNFSLTTLSQPNMSHVLWSYMWHNINCVTLLDLPHLIYCSMLRCERQMEWIKFENSFYDNTSFAANGEARIYMLFHILS